MYSPHINWNYMVQKCIFQERKKEQRQASINLLLDFLEITDKIRGISVGFIISLLYSISGHGYVL